eukprot:gene13443-biopygen6100
MAPTVRVTVPTWTPSYFTGSLSGLVDSVLALALQRAIANGTALSFTDGAASVVVSVVRASNGSWVNSTILVTFGSTGTTVLVQTGSVVTGTSVALVVTTVEVAPDRFTQEAATNRSTNSSSAALPSSTLVSSVVTVDVTKLSGNGSTSSTTVPYFETTVAVTRTNSSGSSTTSTVLVHNCTVGVVETVSLYCASSGVRMNLTCSGLAAATVRRQCPVSSLVCSVVDLSTYSVVSSSYCRTVDLGSSVVCQCGGSGVNGSAIASAGRVSVGVFQVYGAGSFTTSVALASALSASDLASRSALMFASFGCIWGVGLLLLALSSWRLSRRRGSWWTLAKGQAAGGAASLSAVGVDPSVGQAPPPAQSSPGSLSAEASLERLVRSVLPPFYRHRGATVRLPVVGWEVGVQWWRVVATCHPYVRIARSLVTHGRRSLLGDGRSSSPSLLESQCPQGEEEEEDEAEDESPEVVMDVVQALTSLTLACVMLALLYDFQYPEDDGFCAAQTTQATCESRKMLLDPFESQCVWRPDATQTEQAAVIVESVGGVVQATVAVSASSDKTSTDCAFDDSSSSTLAFLVSYLITAAFANVLELFLDRCMEVLRSQPATEALSEKAVLATITVPSPLAEHPLTPMESTCGHCRKANGRWKEELVTRRYPHRLVQQLRYRRVATEMAAPEDGSAAPRARRRRVAVLGVTAVDEPSDGRQRVRPVEAVSDGLDDAHGTVYSSAGDDSVGHAVTQALRSMSSTDYAVTMLRLAVADEVGRLGGPAERHVCLLGLYRAFPAVVTLRRVWLWQCAVVGVLLVCNGGALYYIVSKAAVRGFGWQVSFLQIALFEWFSEVVLLRSVEIALFDYGLCWLVEGEVEAAMAHVAAAAASFTAAGVGVDDAVWSVSQEMARQWPGSFASSDDLHSDEDSDEGSGHMS